MDRVRDDALEITVYANLAQSLGVVHYSPNVKLLLDQLVSWHPALGGGSGELDGQSVGAVLAAFLRPALRAEAGPNDGCSPAGGYSCLPAVASADEVRLALRYGGRGEGPMNMLHEIGRGLGLNPVRLPAANEARVLGEWLEQAECWAHTYLEDSSVVQPCNPVNWQLVLTDLPGVYDQKFLTAGSVTQLGIPRVQRVRFAGSLPAWYRVGFAAPVDVDPLDILPNPPSRHIDYPVDPVTVEASTMCDVPNVSFNQFCAMGSNPDLCETVLGGGQSEKPASAHHTDQMQLQALGMTKPAPISVAGVQALTQGMMSFTLIVP